ncbi:hypothetical protein BDFB_000061 [Asbolus verrucosus]|uniref:Uncharacterized protein n=1 Tax=Asbolus verrucosus TaxID=1661398 RepID=A0A482VH52_ASBVE|nr:hypothetical protein BDFB_000061 [Asbolus verrucosus]
MSVSERDSQEASATGDSGSSKMYRRLMVPDCKHSALLPLVNIDKENYMLRGVSRPGSSEVDLDSFMVCEINSTLSALNAMAGPKQEAAGASDDGTGFCARIVSFHPLMCSCEMSCCCMCGSFCSSDCFACFHEMCARFAAKHVCLKNEEAPPTTTLDHDKVSTSKSLETAENQAAGRNKGESSSIKSIIGHGDRLFATVEVSCGNNTGSVAPDPIPLHPLTFLQIGDLESEDRKCQTRAPHQIPEAPLNPAIHKTERIDDGSRKSSEPQQVRYDIFHHKTVITCTEKSQVPVVMKSNVAVCKFRLFCIYPHVLLLRCFIKDMLILNSYFLPLLTHFLTFFYTCTYLISKHSTKKRER